VGVVLLNDRPRKQVAKYKRLIKLQNDENNKRIAEIKHPIFLIMKKKFKN
jgi:hypothetical protein